MVQIKLVTPMEKEILQNLFEYYVYEFSPYIKKDVGPKGKFGFEKLNDYFIDPSYDPFIIYREEQIVGFCIVQKVSNQNYDYLIDQFFILKRYEGMGLGKAAAFQVFDRYKGRWNVTQIETNYKAQAFWRGIIKAYTNNMYTEHYDENRRSVQRFQT